jgi:hypothetical protein
LVSFCHHVEAAPDPAGSAAKANSQMRHAAAEIKPE